LFGSITSCIKSFSEGVKVVGSEREREGVLYEVVTALASKPIKVLLSRDRVINSRWNVAAPTIVFATAMAQP
jgi:hypothetical protein